MGKYRHSNYEPMTHAQKMLMIDLGFNTRELEFSQFSVKDAHCLISQTIEENKELRKLEDKYYDEDDKKTVETVEPKERWFKGDNDEEWW
jgi:hypothetical protein